MMAPASTWLSYRDLAKSSKILVVGAGGIGCELIKNLVLAGFEDLVVLDLDTIDVTNLNRQFLFQKQHVGKSKALVAKESALRFNPNAKIHAIHDSIMSSEYGVQFFKGFTMVMNALDNRAARSHVNRMCLAANIPLVESGTAGYLGQVTVIRKKHTECYECNPKPHQKTFPGCTIRNTPSEPIHCIVWAKHLFNQLFGEVDPDEDVSPDTEDPEADLEKKAEEDGNVARISTKQWAQEKNYDGEALFNKFFHDDIKYLLTMDKLWQKRKAPEPLKWGQLPEEEEHSAELNDQTVWNIQHCAKVFAQSVSQLQDKLKALPENDHLVWDKDDEPAMNFVASCANIRSQVFHIGKKSKFDIKSMAGNIIPAIATTNAIIAGAIVMEGIKILLGEFSKLRTVYLARKPNPRKKILVPVELDPPRPKCYVCADKHEVSIKLNLEKMTVKGLEDKILKGALRMVAPDVEIDGRGVILISSEEGETEELAEKPLKDFNLADGAILACDDFLQNFSLRVILYHSDKLEDDAEFIILENDVPNVTPAPAEEKDHSNGNGNKNGGEESKNGNGNSGLEPDRKRRKEEDDDDIVALDDVTSAPVTKKMKTAEDGGAAGGDVICID